MNNPKFSANCSDILAPIPIKIINRILETVDKTLAICKKKAVKVGNSSNVKAMLTGNIFGNGLSGKSYICLLTNKKSKYVPMKQEKIMVIINAR